MTYDSSSMRLMGGVPGQQLFLYRSADAAGTVTASGYFNSAIEEYNLSSGDVILAVTSFGGAAALKALIASKSGSAVSVTALS